jgi:hypothetical protein
VDICVGLWLKLILLDIGILIDIGYLSVIRLPYELKYGGNNVEINGNIGWWLYYQFCVSKKSVYICVGLWSKLILVDIGYWDIDVYW